VPCGLGTTPAAELVLLFPGAGACPEVLRGSDSVQFYKFLLFSKETVWPWSGHFGLSLLVSGKSLQAGSSTEVEGYQISGLRWWSSHAAVPTLGRSPTR
jgi:hypothetical protein